MVFIIYNYVDTVEKCPRPPRQYIRGLAQLTHFVPAQETELRVQVSLTFLACAYVPFKPGNINSSLRRQLSPTVVTGEEEN